jgi:broad specificity phosphatase PhoE
VTTTLHLVRHAPHALQDRRLLVGRTPGVGLGGEGREAARRLAARFEGVALDAVLSGPLERATATAAAITERVGPAVEVAAELDEVDFGAWTGRGFAELEGDPAWAAWNVFRSGTRAPGGETMVEVQLRALGLVERLRGRHPGGRVVLVSHGDVIRAALLHFLGLGLDSVHRVEVVPGSVSTVAVGDHGPCILGVNDMGRLP